MTKTATATEPADMYDELSLDERDIFDRIGAAGFKPEMDGSRWVAVRGEERLGPFPELKELGDEVGRIAGDWRLEPGAAVNGEIVDNDPFGVNDDDDLPDGLVKAIADHLDAEDDESAVVEIDADHKGNTYLPGAKPVVDTQLAAAAGDFFAANTEWKDAGKVRKDKQSALDAVVTIKRHLFHQDPDNTNSLIYHAGGLVIRIAKESKTKVTVEEDEDDA